MRFRLEQRFAASAGDVARAYTEPGLYDALDSLPKLGGLQVLDHRHEAEVVHLRVRYRFAGDLSPAVRRVVDPDRLTWVEVSRHDLSTRTVSFELVPDHYEGRLRCSGTARVVEVPPDRSIRHVDGDLSVRFPVVGRAVERAIVSGLDEHLRAEVAVVEGWLAAGHG